MVPSGFLPLTPDLAIEVQSPGDRQRELLDKVGEYLQAGSRLVWVIDPEARTVTVYESASHVATLREDDVLDGGDVLPGFRCRPSDFL
jgi:Uma2 family endonuclease